jgi:hypothetical protein
VPDNIQQLQQKVKERINQKMTDIMHDPADILTLAEQQPISFEKYGKIFYWNPGPVPHSRLTI